MRELGLALVLAAAWLILGTSAAAAAGPAHGTGPGREGVVALVPGEQGPTQPGGGGGGPDLGLLVAVGAGVGVAAAVVGGGYLALRRRASEPQAPPSPAEGGDWWTCRNCGRNNLVGSARCYACGTWQR